MNIYRKIINTKPKYPDGFDNRCKSLVKHLLRRDLSKRFGNLKNGAEDLKTHRFFEEISYPDLVDRKLKVPYTPDVKELKLQECNWDKEKTVGVKTVPTGDDPFLDW